jgi:predicted MFS family arabinose efflux permease
VTVRTQGLPVARGDTTLLQEIGEALRYALRTPRIRLILTILLVVSLCVFNFTVYVPLFARRVLAQGAEGFGFLMARVGVGAVTGALALGFLPRRPPPARPHLRGRRDGLPRSRHDGSGEQLCPRLPVLFVIGVASIMAAAGCNSTLQLSAPDAMRGRVMSLYTLVFGGVFPIGSFLVGTIAEVRGVPTAFVSGGTAGLAGLAAVAVWWRLRSGRRGGDVSGFPS